MSYSFSLECPASQRRFFLQQAREAFAVGLLTKSEGEPVTSQQELHTFLKAAYSITVAHKWLGDPQEVVEDAGQVCQKALAKFYDYCSASTQDKELFCAEIMRLVAQVKLLLGVGPFSNSDKGSFIPDSYRNVKDSSVRFTHKDFLKIMQRFQKYHESLCKITINRCKGRKDVIEDTRLCFTALGTNIGTLDTECRTKGGEASANVHLCQRSDMCTTLGSTDNLGSSWQKLSISSSGSPQPRSGAVQHRATVSNQSCISTEDGANGSGSMLQSAGKNRNQNPQYCNSGFVSHAPQRLGVSSFKAWSDSKVPQAGTETFEEDWVTDVAGAACRQSVDAAGVHSLSQLTLRSSSSSLGDSFGSQSSWEKIPAGHPSPTDIKPQPNQLSKAGSCQNIRSPASDGNFFVLETLDCESSRSALDVTYKNQTSGWKGLGGGSGLGKVRPSSKLQPPGSLNAYNMDTEVDPEAVKPGSTNCSAAPYKHPQAVPQTSTESSFEVLEGNESAHWYTKVTSAEEGLVKQRKNSSCYSCLNHNAVTAGPPARQFLLSRQDYQALLAGVCHECLLRRLQTDKTQFKLHKHRTAHSKFVSVVTETVMQQDQGHHENTTPNQKKLGQNRK